MGLATDKHNVYAALSAHTCRGTPEQAGLQSLQALKQLCLPREANRGS